MRSYPAPATVIALLLTTLCLVNLAESRSTTYVVFTTDVCWVCGNDFQGEWHGKEYGVPLIVEKMEKYGVKGTFFVSPYCPPALRSAMFDNLRFLVSHGEDVELHTHTDTIDPSRLWLNMYNEAERRSILATGMRYIEAAGAPPPIAHRAGGYSIDYLTLRLLPEFGITMDSSIKPQSDRAKVPLPSDKVNRFTKIGGVYQLPITQIGMVPYFGYTGTTALGVDWTIWLQQDKALDMLANHEVPVVTIFLHYHSLYRHKRPSRDFEPLIVLGPDEENIEELEDILRKTTSDKRFKVVTARELWEVFTKDPTAFESEAYIPYTGLWLTYRKAWTHFFGHGIKNQIVVLSPLVVSGLIGMVIACLVRFRRRPPVRRNS